MTVLGAGAQRHALRAWRFTSRVGLHEAAVVAASFLVYFLIRGAVVDRADEAIERARDLMRLQEQTGIAHELQMQSWILGHYFLIKTLNWIYFWGHMPAIIVLAIWLYLRHRRAYTLTRNAFLASGAIAVIMYWVLPVAPPRLVPESGLVDTMALYDKVGYNAQETKAFVNAYAAMPSLHFGWSMLLGAVVAFEGRRPLFIAFGVIWPVAMFFAVVMTGNHFIIDAIAGGIVSFAGFGIALGMERMRPRATGWLQARIHPEAHVQQRTGP